MPTEEGDLHLTESVPCFRPLRKNSCVNAVLISMGGGRGPWCPPGLSILLARPRSSCERPSRGWIELGVDLATRCAQPTRSPVSPDPTRQAEAGVCGPRSSPDLSHHRSEAGPAGPQIKAGTAPRSGRLRPRHTPENRCDEGVTTLCDTKILSGQALTSFSGKGHTCTPKQEPSHTRVGRPSLDLFSPPTRACARGHVFV